MESYCSVDDAAVYAEAKMMEQFNKFKLSKYMKFPMVLWDDLGKNAAGFAELKTNKITLNTNYLYSKSWQNFLDETPLHELAHLVTFNIYHTSGHNKDWRHVCKMFGLAGNRCHKFETPENIKARKSRKPSQTHIVYCPCMEHKVSNIIYKRLTAGEEYLCTHCNHKLTKTPY